MTSQDTEPIEGHFIITDDDLIFEVKGVIHPSDRVIAYLRYIKDDSGDRRSRDGNRFRKVYDLVRREKELREKYPHYLWFDETRGRLFQSVPRDRISFVLNPMDGLRQLRDMGSHVSDLEKASRNLAEVIVDRAGIDWNNLGITGSQLVGLATRRSDIDLVIYGEGPGKRLHSALKNRLQDFEGIEQYHGQRLQKHLEFRWGEQKRWKSELRKIEAQKVFQGLFESYDFFMRAVKLPSEMHQRYEDLVVQDKGFSAVRCVVTQASDSIFTPCNYLIDCDSHPELQKLVSYRGRFTEHVSEGMSVEASGRLESVKDLRSGAEFMQLVLGESAQDYLIPV